MEKIFYTLLSTASILLAVAVAYVGAHVCYEFAKYDGGLAVAVGMFFIFLAVLPVALVIDGFPKK